MDSYCHKCFHKTKYERSYVNLTVFTVQSNDRFHLFQDSSHFPNLNHWSRKSKKSPECQRWKRMSREFMLETDWLQGVSVFYPMSYIHDLSTMLPRICRKQKAVHNLMSLQCKTHDGKPKETFCKMSCHIYIIQSQCITTKQSQCTIHTT